MFKSDVLLTDMSDESIVAFESQKMARVSLEFSCIRPGISVSRKILTGPFQVSSLSYACSLTFARRSAVSCFVEVYAYLLVRHNHQGSD